MRTHTGAKRVNPVAFLAYKDFTLKQQRLYSRRGSITRGALLKEGLQVKGEVLRFVRAHTRKRGPVALLAYKNNTL